MNFVRKTYEEQDFLRIRDFLKSSLRDFPQKKNWLIDRWNFSRYFGHVMHGTFQTWPETVGIWEDENNEIVAVVSSDGENRGGVFFQLADREFSEEFLNELVCYAERQLVCKKGEDVFINLRVNEDAYSLKDIIKNRGYALQEWTDPMSSVCLNTEFAVLLPEGFRIADGNEVDDYRKGFAHGRAFGYYNNDVPDDDDAERCFKALREAPDYLPKLDLSVLDQNNEVAAFACIWYDDLNKIGILEPVGTIPKHRKMGLGKTVIYEGINRVKRMGAEKVFVGSSQQFYLSIGFKIEYKKEIWQKKF